MEGFWPIFFLAVILKIPVAALLYLLEGGDYVTGEVLVVDGGRLLR